MIQIPLFGAFQGGTSYVQNVGSWYVHKFWWFLVCATSLSKNQLPTGCNWWCNHMQLMMQPHATGCHWFSCGLSKIQKFCNQLWSSCLKKGSKDQTGLDFKTLTATGNYSMCSGEYCWMMNSLKHIDMGSSAGVATGLLINYILAYLHIQLTIPKSEWALVHTSWMYGWIDSDNTEFT